MMYSFHIGPAQIPAQERERDEEQAGGRSDMENWGWPVDMWQHFSFHGLFVGMVR
jgi:hypothetical protein